MSFPEQQIQHQEPIIPEISQLLKETIVPMLRRNLPSSLEKFSDFLDTIVVEKLKSFELRIYLDSNYTSIRELASFSGIPPTYFVLFSFISFLLVIRALLKSASHILADLIGFTYPMIQTLDGIEKTSSDADNHVNKEPKVQWPSYWIIFFAVKFLDHLKSITDHIPYFTISKISFLIWCMHPRTLGASLIYSKYISPFWKSKQRFALLHKLLTAMKSNNDDSDPGPSNFTSNNNRSVLSQTSNILPGSFPSSFNNTRNMNSSWQSDLNDSSYVSTGNLSLQQEDLLKLLFAGIISKVSSTSKALDDSDASAAYVKYNQLNNSSRRLSDPGYQI